jgi:hypothetical protein
MIWGRIGSNSSAGGIVAVTCPIDFEVASLPAEVQTMYSRVAASPDGEFHFDRGPQYAATMLGYCARILPGSALRDIDLWTG